MTPEQYCQEKAAPYGSDLYYALYFAGTDQRPALQALHAAYAELADIVHEVSDVGVARMKLQWWREELARAYARAGQHPVSQALQTHVLPRVSDARAYLDEIVDGVAMDLEYGLYPTLRELSVYCHRTGGALARLSVEICGYHDGRTRSFAHDLGMGLRLTALLRELRPNLDAGRLYIPEDELHSAGLTRETLLERADSEAVRELLAKQAERAADFLRSALEHLSAEDRAAQRFSLILIELDRAQMKEIEAEGFPLLRRSIHLTPVRKLWIAWRTARRAKPKGAY